MLTTISSAEASEDHSTLGDWLEEWLGLCEVRGLRQTTIEGYRRGLDLYLPASLKEDRIGDLRPPDVNALYARLFKTGRRRGAGGLSVRPGRFPHTGLRKGLPDACP